MAEDYANALGALDRLAALHAEKPGHVFFRAIVLDKIRQQKPALESYQRFLAMSKGENPNEEFQARQRIKILEREIGNSDSGIGIAVIGPARYRRGEIGAGSERRSELALANADKEIDAAKEAFKAATRKLGQQALVEVTEFVDVSYDALEHSKQAPRKSKYYKNAELKVRALLRRLSGFRDEVGFDGRAAVDAVIKRVSDVHDELLSAIMSKKK